MAEIVQLLVSAHRRYAGRPTTDVAPPPDELVDRVELRAGLGIVGDRYFNRPAHRDAGVTIMAAESLSPFGAAGLAQTRRNILVRGVDVDGGRGRTLVLDSGDGPVRLRLNNPARPCRWMDVALGPGAWKGLQGRGGMRCTPLDDGVLRVGPAVTSWAD